MGVLKTKITQDINRGGKIEWVDNLRNMYIWDYPNCE